MSFGAKYCVSLDRNRRFRRESSSGGRTTRSATGHIFQGLVSVRTRDKPIKRLQQIMPKHASRWSVSLPLLTLLPCRLGISIFFSFFLGHFVWIYFVALCCIHHVTHSPFDGSFSVLITGVVSLSAQRNACTRTYDRTYCLTAACWLSRFSRRFYFFSCLTRSTHMRALYNRIHWHTAHEV